IYIVDLVKEFLKAIVLFDKNLFIKDLFPILALGLGIVLGVIMLSKAIEKLLQKTPKLVYSAILGLICASPFAIIYQLFNPGDPKTAPYREILRKNLVLSIIVGVLFLVFGVLIADYLSKFEKHHPSKAKLDR
ncbi:MAG TPA: DUF368 domain-containing protein, partial [Bacilli bacterium]